MSVIVQSMIASSITGVSMMIQQWKRFILTEVILLSGHENTGYALS